MNIKQVTYEKAPAIGWARPGQSGCRGPWSAYEVTQFGLTARFATKNQCYAWGWEVKPQKEPTWAEITDNGRFSCE